jgi:SAM-dependent methyltransferase
MGRWSGIVAESFTDWLALSSGLKWLDIGCGSGALSEAVINKNKPAKLIAIDQSESFLNTAKKRLESLADCIVGNALSLPLVDSLVDATVSGLVLNFIPEPVKALAEMRRVTTPGGGVAIYVWDYAGKMDFLNHFWDIAVEQNPKTSILHEGHRFPESNADGLLKIFKQTGLVEIETTPIELTTNFRDFDDYWKPFLGGQGPAPTYVQSLDKSERIKLRDALLERLPIQVDGSISMLARAWAAKGIVEK